MNQKKLKIAIVATNGISLTNFRGKLVASWIKSGYEVTCVSIEHPEEIAESVERLGAEYFQVAGSRTGIGVLSELKMIRDYYHFFKKQRPDYVYLYMSKPVAYGGPAAVLAKVPHINVLINGLENAYYRTGLKDAIVRTVMSTTYRFMGRKAENVFFQNQDDYQYFIDHRLVTHKNSHIVSGSGVDMEHFEKKNLPDKPVFLMIARLLWSKGIREYLAAIPKLKATCPDADVLLVGGLDENDEALTREELEAAVKENSIEYCGYSSDVRPYLERCSVFVLPSYHEGTPRSVLEAMATGRAVITTDAPGCRETVVDGENGFLVPVKDAYALAEKMITLAEDTKLREKMAEESYRICCEKYDVKIINESTNRIIFREYLI